MVRKTPKMQFYRSSRIIYEIWIHSKNEELAARVDKIGLGWFGVIPVKLWSENVEKSQKDNFTVVLLLFMKIWIFEKFGEFFSESIKLDWGDLELFRRSYGRFTEKNTHLLRSLGVLALFTIRDQDFNFFSELKDSSYQFSDSSSI